MNGDALELMQRLGEIHADLKQDIGIVTTKMAEFKGSFEARLANVETDIKDGKYWHNVKTLIVVPVVFSLHKAATMLGFKI